MLHLGPLTTRNNNMQPSDQTGLTEVILESRIPISTLRSTASPYKQGHLGSTTFSQYLAELTSLNPRLRIDLSERFVEKSDETVDVGTSSSSQQSNVSTKYASILTNSTSIQPVAAKISTSVDIDAKYAYKTPSEAPSSPLAVPSSPSSYAADFSSELDIGQDYDDMTESDHLEVTNPPISDKENDCSSPFSSPLSTAPSSPISQNMTAFSSLDTTTSSPQSPLHQTNSSRSIGPRPRDSVLPRTTTVKKRARSPSPNHFHRRKPSKCESRDPWRESSSRDSTSTKDSMTGTGSQSFNMSSELVGSLIQTLALSGRSSMPTSAIMEEMLASTPSLRSGRSVEEWTSILVDIMAINPIFGRADRKGLKVSIFQPCSGGHKAKEFVECR
jgi:hypothetical protein